MRSIARLGATFTTVHAGGGAAVAAAAEAAKEVSPEGPVQLPVCTLAVTVLTSHDEGELQALYATGESTTDLVRRLGRSAVAAGAGGLVCSPLEIEALRAEVGAAPILVVPGIRPAGSARGDQSRVSTPAQALGAGADFLVVGRPILRDDAPHDALLRVLDEMNREM
jgi:orotidine-5'-phosphate decarboxylase